MSDTVENKPAETKPTVPALDLESADSGSSAGAMDRKRSLSGKLKGKIKKMLTPRSTHSSSSNLAAKDAESVSEVSESVAEAEAPSVTEEKVPSRFSQQKEEVVEEESEKKEEADKEEVTKEASKPPKGLIGGAAVGVALVLGIILAGCAKKGECKEKPVEEEKEKKKGMFARK